MHLLLGVLSTWSAVFNLSDSHSIAADLLLSEENKKCIKTTLAGG